MSESGIAAIVFVCLAVASLGAMSLYPKLPARHRDDETNAVVRLVANIFVILASLVFGLMINSAKNTYESVDKSVHAYATQLILLDRALRAYGAGAEDARGRLIAYVAEAIRHPIRADDVGTDTPDWAGGALSGLGEGLRSLRPPDADHEGLLAELKQQFRLLAAQRWAIIEQSEGTIPRPLIWLLAAWMTLVFASFGYRAPRNEIVAASFLASAGLIAAGFYLVLNMDVPFAGPIQVSDAPLHRALAEMKM